MINQNINRFSPLVRIGGWGFFEIIVKKNFVVRSEEETANFAKIVASELFPGDIICLEGDLGAGKTTFTQGVASGLEVPDDQYVTSPSFAIMHQYDGKIPLYHFDFYRLGMVDEIIDLGFEELFYGEGVCVIEWAERAEEILPRNCLTIHLSILDEQQRKVEISWSDDLWQKKIDAIFSKLSS